jgi:mannosyltransferase OCH1-like enzyme
MPQLTADDFLRDPDQKVDELNGIPKIIHQTWKTREVPERFRELHESWKRLMPDWTIVVWSDEDNQHLAEKYFSPADLRVYNNLNLNIQRIDMIRCVYLKVFGGIYADLDFEALRSFESVVEKMRGSVALVETDTPFNERVQNSLMISERGHPLWDIYAESIGHNARTADATADTVGISGPRALGHAWLRLIQDNQTMGDVEVLPSKQFLEGVGDEAFSKHHYAHTWQPAQTLTTIVSGAVQYWHLVALAVLLVMVLGAIVGAAVQGAIMSEASASPSGQVEHEPQV